MAAPRSSTSTGGDKMHKELRRLLLITLLPLAFPLWGQDQQATEIEILRSEITQLRADYDARIEDLEHRLEAAENKAELASQEASQATVAADEQLAAPVFTPAPSGAVANNAFNPALGVIFQGQAWAYDKDPDEYYIPGFPLGGEAGLAPEGFSLAETEINISANVDDKFTAWLTVPIAVEDGEVGIELEEAWVETLKLPAGLSLRMGRFFSSIGYLNSKHFHSWDFADQPLVYQAFLGGQYLDDGLQARWLAPTDFYLELSGELLRGDRYPAGGAPHSGLGSYTLAAQSGGDIGFSNSWLFGFSWLHANSDGRESGGEDDPLFFNGDSDILIADFVWKWAPNGNSRQRNFKFQAEYMWRKEDGDYALPNAALAGPAHLPSALPWDSDQKGWYAQAIYQPWPQWRFGGRIERLSSDTPVPIFTGSVLDPLGMNPSRYSLMADWSNSEFSRLRLQYNHDKAGTENDNQFALQYIYSIGAHGAHAF
jgi:hypothetical protein